MEMCFANCRRDNLLHQIPHSHANHFHYPFNMRPARHRREELVISLLLLFQKSFHVLRKVMLWLLRLLRLSLTVLSLVLFFIIILVCLLLPIVHFLVAGINYGENAVD